MVGEAFRQWIGTDFITVDIDESAASADLPKIHGPSFTHFTADALSASLDREIGIDFGDVECGLCNPPYIHPKWRKHFGEILEAAGLSSVTQKISGLPADVLFVAQNLRFLSQSGKLGLILPDGIVAGEKFSAIRKTLATKHTIERVIELPRRIFHKTEAKAHILIIGKNGPAGQEIKIQKLLPSGGLSAEILIEPEQASRRLDYSFLNVENASQRINSQSLSDLGVKIKRGGYSSAQIGRLDFPVFHTTDFDRQYGAVPPCFSVNKRQLKLVSKFVAEPGDILIARVGRNLDQKICSVSHGPVVISDSVFALRAPDKIKQKIIDYLSSQNGKAMLRSISHGVGANFITVSALQNLHI